MLWLYGGWKVYISGDRGVYEAVKADYAPGGAREFDADFMANVYERPFEVVFVDGLPAEYSRPQAVGRHLDGCRIGFDAGGSDRKGERRHRRRERLLRGGRLVPEGDGGPRLPLRGHRLRAEVRGGAHAIRISIRRFLRRHLYRQPHDGGPRSSSRCRRTSSTRR